MNLTTLTSPNSYVDQRYIFMMGVAQTTLALILWLITPMGLLPMLPEVLTAVGNVWQSGFVFELFTSLVLISKSLLVMCAVSMAISYATVVPVFRPFASMFAAGRYNGFIGLPLLLMILIGDQHYIKLCLLVFGMSVFTVQGMTDIIKSIPSEAYDHARTLRMSEWRIVWEVVILGQIDKVIEVFRGNLAIGWMMLPMVEGMFRVDGGIGVAILNYDKHRHLAEVYVIQLVVLTIGIVSDILLGKFKTVFCPYSAMGVK